MDPLPDLRVTVFSDYICPFCFIGALRLDRLRDEFQLKVNWAFLEIHPDTPGEGRPVDELGYGQVRWSEMMTGLDDMAREEHVEIGNLAWLSNSRLALRLAEATKEEGAERFYRLHRRLFEAYFCEGVNIGDIDELRELSIACGLERGALEMAVENQAVTRRLGHYQKMAYQAAVTGTPTFIINGKKLEGAVSYERLLEAARTTDEC